MISDMYTEYWGVSSWAGKHEGEEWGIWCLAYL
jgi:hypothetical protein